MEIFTSELFLGAFFGSFLSFCFYLLSQYLIRKVPKWNEKRLIKKNKKAMNDLFKLFLLEKDSDSIFYDLIQLFRLKIVEQVLKGSVIYSGEHLQFVNNLWTIIIENNLVNTRFTIQYIERSWYVLDSKLSEQNKPTLSKLIKYYQEKCKEANIKLKQNKEIRFALEKLFNTEKPEQIKPNN